MKNKLTSAHIIVSGKVQGVYFRQTTCKRAQALNLTGWVKNTPNNTVELTVSGDPDAINQLTEWLWEGPSAANVTHVESTEKPFEPFENFFIKK